MCGGGEKVHEWTLIPASPLRDEPDLHLVDILFHSRIKVDLTENLEGNSKRQPHRENA